MYKIGNSIDIHPLTKGAPLFIGGVKIESEKGCLSHSDGDALLHSIAESIIGALGKGDLGTLFPDNTEEFKGVSSTIFIEKCNELLEKEGYKISNIDCMIVLEKPKLNTYKEAVKSNIAKLLNIKEDQINIKAGTNEKIGSIGNNDSFLTWTSCLLEKK